MKIQLEWSRRGRIESFLQLDIQHVGKDPTFPLYPGTVRNLNQGDFGYPPRKAVSLERLTYTYVRLSSLTPASPDLWAKALALPAPR